MSGNLQRTASLKSQTQPQFVVDSTDQLGEQLPKPSESRLSTQRRSKKQKSRDELSLKVPAQNAKGRRTSISRSRLRESSKQQDSSFEISNQGNLKPPDGKHLRHRKDRRNSAGLGVDERVRSFPTQTSCHGISRAFSGDRNWIYKRLWAFVTLTSLCILLVCVYEIREKYMTRPFVIHTLTTEETGLPFPAVTICSLSELDTRKVSLMSDVANASAKLFNLFATESFLSYTPLSQYLDDPEYDDILNLPRETVYSIAAPSVDDLLLHCSYNTRPFRCASRFYRYRLAPHCFQFNINRSSVVWQYSLGPRSGLAVVIRGDSQGYLIGHTMAAGAKVTLHRHGTFANVALKGSLLRPGSTTFMKLEVTEEWRLPYPFKSYGNSYCREMGISYTRENCINQCLTKKTSSICKCSAFLDIMDANGKTYHKCTFREYMKCFRPKFADYLCQSSEANTRCQQKCLMNCHQYTYKTQESYAEFLSTEASEYLDENRLFNVSGSYMELRIFFEEMKKTKISYSPYYTKEVILGVMGGHMGFFLGASFITLFEMVEVAFYALSWLYVYLRDKTKLSAQDPELDEPEMKKVKSAEGLEIPQTTFL